MRYLIYYDLINSNIIDDLHTIYSGVVKKLLKLYFEKKIFSENTDNIDNEIISNGSISEISNMKGFCMLSDWKAKDFM